MEVLVTFSTDKDMMDVARRYQNKIDTPNVNFQVSDLQYGTIENFYNVAGMGGPNFSVNELPEELSSLNNINEWTCSLVKMRDFHSVGCVIIRERTITLNTYALDETLLPEYAAILEGVVRSFEKVEEW
jgi:hypothetical protein